jgi:hypothetical protein
VGYTYSWGRTAISVMAWDFYRMAGSANGASAPDTKENIANAELHVSHQFSPRLALEPLVGFRQWNPADHRGGRLATFGLNGRVGLGDRVSVIASVRGGTGWVYEPSRGRADVTGAGASVLLRYQP